MKKRWAFLTIAGALAVGIAAGIWLMRPMHAAMRMSVACTMLSEAEKAGYLDTRKRGLLVAELETSPALTAGDRSYVPLLGQCAAM
jgi:hypothetical protein